MATEQAILQSMRMDFHEVKETMLAQSRVFREQQEEQNRIFREQQVEQNQMFRQQQEEQNRLLNQHQEMVRDLLGQLAMGAGPSCARKHANAVDTGHADTPAQVYEYLISKCKKVPKEVVALLLDAEIDGSDAADINDDVLAEVGVSSPRDRMRIRRQLRSKYAHE